VVDTRLLHLPMFTWQEYHPIEVAQPSHARRNNRMAKPKPVTTETLIDDLHAVIRDAESLLKATAAQTGEKVQEVRERAEESVRQAKERLAGVEDEALQRAKALAVDAEEYVRGNPWQAVGIAAGIGLVLGLLMSRR
jgi:ElaB/YqjD/DUF883 family membrane-anchored ribosome-binding protein